MANSRTVDVVIADADRLAKVWTDNASFSMGDVTLAKVKADTDLLREKKQRRDEMRIELTRLIDETNDLAKLVDSYVTRGRSGIKAFFGPDSPQYDQVGGTRQSARKPRSTKKNPTPQS